ncbi:MAG: histidine kinase [Chitinophagaceae bacterium]|nr:histidine kinase [Chitinophagaceae bacterium]
MIWPFQHKQEARYWLKVFAMYAMIEACIQLMFLIVLNNFGKQRISIVELHILMWFFQCLLIWPIWWVAKSVYKKPVLVQVVVNIAFYLIYSYCWFGPVQDLIGYLYENLQSLTRAPDDRQVAILDSGNQYSYLNYQLLKHSFRLSVFFLAAYFYNYRLEEKKRLALAVANRELQIRMLKWHLNPSFYFKTIQHLQQLAAGHPAKATEPILQLAKVMEYVIYEAKEKLIDVKKEINFLVNYTRLLNEHNTNVVIEATINGDYEKLKISPLLLVGIIDRIISDGNGTRKTHYRMGLDFSGREMKVALNANADKKDLSSLLTGDSQSRLQELYPGKFNFENSNGTVKLSIILDEE